MSVSAGIALVPGSNTSLELRYWLLTAFLVYTWWWKWLALAFVMLRVCRRQRSNCACKCSINLVLHLSGMRISICSSLLYTY